MDPEMLVAWSYVVDRVSWWQVLWLGSERKQRKGDTGRNQPELQF